MDHHVRLIAKDLHRTDFISEKKSADYNYGPLTRLLVTFACYNPTIGYSQGIYSDLTREGHQLFPRF